MICLLWHELKEWLSHPVRLVILDGSESTCYGILRAVDFSRCIVDLLDAPTTAIAGNVRTELLSSSHLLRFVTRGDADAGAPHQVNLAMTDQIEVVQRRQHPRVQVDLPTWIQVLPLSQEAVDVPAPIPAGPPHGRTVNISAGGLALMTSHPAKSGDRVKLTVVVDKRITLTDILAKVTRTQPQSSGTELVALQFEQLSAEVVAVVSKMVAQSLEVSVAHVEYGRVLLTDG